MSTVTAVRLEGVGKSYRLGVSQGTGALLSERLQHALTRPFRAVAGRRGPGSHLRSMQRERRELWVLKDVSLELAQGEVVGLIGRNGAGKSTLLKLLSGITPPSEGRVTTWGRVATLLEVGTGFHPELTGRENIFVNGAILGMRRREIEQRFDEIVEFSGVERFIDTPVKRYSSGMYVRLAFSIAAHLEPEILLVDEVLAVGDADFQRKCLGRMREVSEHGRTVVFVSHNMPAIQRLCSRAFLIDGGGVAASGPPDEVVADYLTRAGPAQVGGTAVIPADAERFRNTEEAVLRRVTLSNLEGEPRSSVRLGEDFRVSMVFESQVDLPDAAVEVGISTIEGQRIATAQSVDCVGESLSIAKGLNVVEAEIELTLLPGEYTLDIGLHHMRGLTIDFVIGAFRFTGLNVPEGDHESWLWPEVRGFVRPRSSWSTAQPVLDTSALAPTEGSAKKSG